MRKERMLVVIKMGMKRWLYMNKRMNFIKNFLKE